MNCPNCGGKVAVIDTTSTPDGEIYRKRKCRECNYVFYTVEIEVEFDEAVRDAWNRFYRSNSRKGGSHENL